MRIDLAEGKYVVAVSGGVDSVVLLHLLSQLPTPNSHLLIIAHFDHGIREDSALDETFVKELADRLGIEFTSERVVLGADASEATARDARYEFLRRTLKNHGAHKIITAHHQDDLLETMILNMLRGTGRRGLDPFVASVDVVRPLQSYTKKDILDYASKNSLAWREDSTNTNPKYKRNNVRQHVMPRLKEKRQELIVLNEKSRILNIEINTLLKGMDEYLLLPNSEIIRQRFVTIPHKVASEYMHWWLSNNNVKDVDITVVTRATIAAKTLKVGKKFNLGNGKWLRSEKDSVKIMPD